MSMFSNFDKTFRPWKKWENKSLIAENPCNNCEVHKEFIENRYFYMMSGGSDEELAEQCKHCVKHITWTMDCIQKLKWYEEQDERLKQHGKEN